MTNKLTRGLSAGWISVLLVVMMSGSIINKQFCVMVFEKIRLVQVAEDAGVLAVMVLVGISLAKLHPIFKWWAGRLLPRWRSKETPSNINFAPLKVPGIAQFYLVLLIFQLPVITWFEEWIFRYNLMSWKEAVLWSLLFGLSHLLIGVPLYGAIVISITGLWYSFIYFHEGLMAATIHHTTYDGLLALVLLGSVVIRDTSRWNARMAEVTAV